MKNLCIPFLLLSAWLACHTPAQGQTAAGDEATSAPDVSIELQVVAVPERISFPLIRDLKDAAKREAAYQQIQELLMNGTAKLIGWPMLTTRSGERAVVEAVNEIRYAMEYTPGGVGVYLTTAKNQFGIFPEVPKKLKEIKGVELNAVPTAFETRNVGVTLEVEPVVLKDGIVSMNLVAQHVRFKAMRKVHIEREKTGERMIVEQPEFESHKVTTGLRLKSGERKLLGVFKTSEPPDHLELFILKAEVQELEPIKILKSDRP